MVVGFWGWELAVRSSPKDLGLNSELWDCFRTVPELDFLGYFRQPRNQNSGTVLGQSRAGL